MLCRMNWVLCAIRISQFTSVLKIFFRTFFKNKYWHSCFIFLLFFRDLKNADIIFVVLDFISLPNTLSLYFYFQCCFKLSRGPLSWNMRFCSSKPFLNLISLVSIPLCYPLKQCPLSLKQQMFLFPHSFAVIWKIIWSWSTWRPFSSFHWQNGFACYDFVF